MKLIIGDGGAGGGYYPFTQKPVDYQPYRPLYLYRGPPPDAGFSYGLYEDPDSGEQYYSELGLESFSPLNGKFSKLLQEVDYEDLQRELKDGLNMENLEHVECGNCGADYYQNFKKHLKGKDQYYCHKCGGDL